MLKYWWTILILKTIFVKKIINTFTPLLSMNILLKYIYI